MLWPLRLGFESSLWHFVAFCGIFICTSFFPYISLAPHVFLVRVPDYMKYETTQYVFLQIFNVNNTFTNKVELFSVISSCCELFIILRKINQLKWYIAIQKVFRKEECIKRHCFWSIPVLLNNSVQNLFIKFTHVCGIILSQCFIFSIVLYTCCCGRR